MDSVLGIWVLPPSTTDVYGLELNFRTPHTTHTTNLNNYLSHHYCTCYSRSITLSIIRLTVLSRSITLSIIKKWARESLLTLQNPWHTPLPPPPPPPPTVPSPHLLMSPSYLFLSSSQTKANAQEIESRLQHLPSPALVTQLVQPPPAQAAASRPSSLTPSNSMSCYHLPP